MKIQSDFTIDEIAAIVALLKTINQYSAISTDFATVKERIETHTGLTIMELADKIGVV